MMKIGIPLQVSHFFIFYFAVLSAITPPVCAAIFISSGIAKSNWFKTGVTACMMALPIFIIPFSFTYCNGLLLMPGESLGTVVYAFVTSFIGVISVSIGVAGFNRKNLVMWQRGVLIGAGVVMLTPNVVFSSIALVVFAVLYLQTKKPEAKPA